MTTQQITRRAFLAATAIVAVAVPATTAAAATPSPKHSTRAAVREAITTTQGNASVTVSASVVQDVTAINYTITDISPLPDTFTVSVTDLNNGRQSRKIAYALGSGDSASAIVYGALNHTFQVNVCQSDGTCFTVGPIGATQTGGPAQGITAGPNHVGPTP